MKKNCKACGQEKQERDFYQCSDGRNRFGVCMDCHRARMRLRYHTRKSFPNWRRKYETKPTAIAVLRNMVDPLAQQLGRGKR